jgi:hypothetical protein
VGLQHLDHGHLNKGIDETTLVATPLVSSSSHHTEQKMIKVMRTKL